MLSRRPDARFESADALGRALAQYLARAAEPASASHLAEFVHLVQPPPPLAEGGEALESGDTVVRASFSLHGAPSPASAVPNLMEELNAEWAPAGPVMDATGKVEGRPQTPPRPVSARRGPPVVEEEPLELAERPSRGNAAAASNSTEPEPLPAVPDLSVIRPTGTKLPQSGMGKWVFLIAVLGLAGGGVYLWPSLAGKKSTDIPKALAAKLPAARTAVLHVNSEPEGASVKINGTVVGTTPLITENLYPQGELEVTVNLRGYRTWTGKFQGGKDAQLDALLLRK
jgi:eukaryotic-like serine/threonine-protein kinase